MPKMKSKSGAKKRFKVSAGGKVKYSAARRRHILTKKRKKVKRKMRGWRVLVGPDANHITRLLPYGAG